MRDVTNRHKLTRNYINFARPRSNFFSKNARREIVSWNPEGCNQDIFTIFLANSIDLHKKGEYCI